MYIRIKTSSKTSKQSIQIVQTLREGKKVSQKILLHVGQASNEVEVDRLKILAGQLLDHMKTVAQPVLFPDDQLAEMVFESRINSELDTLPIDVNLKKLKEENRIITGIHDIYGRIYNTIGFDSLLKSCPISSRVLKDIVLARIARPSSKRASAEILEKDFGIHHSLDTIYHMMDFVDQELIQKMQRITYEQSKNLFGGEINVMFYDCTTLYFESFTEDELREYGYSKDHKFNQSQVLLTLLVTTDGLPIGYEVFNGSMFEGHTLTSILEKIRFQYKVSRVILVADSALLSNENIRQLTQNNIEYIVGARLKSLSKKWQDTILDNRDYLRKQKEDELLRISDLNYDKNRRLIVSHSSKRAEKDLHDRRKAIERLMSKLDKSKSVKELISNYGYKKYILINQDAPVELNQQKMDQDAQWDGLHGVFTNIRNLTGTEILSHYQGLWQIEESFRIHKHDLRIRPVFHWSPQRVRAHIAICYMAFALIRYLQNILKSMYLKLSPETVRDQLVHVQCSILQHNTTFEKYIIPSKPGIHVNQIYKAIGLSYSRVPFRLVEQKQ